jgi:hypothetical protein
MTRFLMNELVRAREGCAEAPFSAKGEELGATSRLFAGTSYRFKWALIPISPLMSGAIFCPKVK